MMWWIIIINLKLVYLLKRMEWESSREFKIINTLVYCHTLVNYFTRFETLVILKISTFCRRQQNNFLWASSNSLIGTKQSLGEPVASVREPVTPFGKRLTSFAVLITCYGEPITPFRTSTCPALLDNAAYQQVCVNKYRFYGLFLYRSPNHLLKLSQIFIKIPFPYVPIYSLVTMSIHAM